MTSSNLCSENGTQIIRLPEALFFPENVHQVDILKIGRSRLIAPQGERWNDIFQNGPRATKDFMIERAQPPVEQRR